MMAYRRAGLRICNNTPLPTNACRCMPSPIGRACTPHPDLASLHVDVVELGNGLLRCGYVQRDETVASGQTRLLVDHDNGIMHGHRGAKLVPEDLCQVVSLHAPWKVPKVQLLAALCLQLRSLLGTIHLRGFGRV